MTSICSAIERQDLADSDEDAGAVQATPEVDKVLQQGGRGQHRVGVHKANTRQACNRGASFQIEQAVASARLSVYHILQLGLTCNSRTSDSILKEYKGAYHIQTQSLSLHPNLVKEISPFRGMKLPK